VKADLKTKFILTTKTTSARVHDSQVFEELLDAQDLAVLADSAYHSAEHEADLIKLNAQEFLMRKATRGHPLSEALATDQPHHQPHESEGGAHLRAYGADGGRPMSKHRTETSHAAQPPQQPGL
jgi:IS5 family transposase